jgi:hypothetical protein
VHGPRGDTGLVVRAARLLMSEPPQSQFRHAYVSALCCAQVASARRPSVADVSPVLQCSRRGQVSMLF